MKRIYLARHAQTDNLKTNLTEIGMIQSQLLCAYLNKIDFDEIYCSNLIRAKKTIQNLNNNLIKYTDILSERKLSEPSEELIHFLSSLTKDKILLLAHGNIIRMIISYFTKIPIKYINVFCTRNTSITILQKEKGFWKIRQAGSTEHLSPEVIT